MASSTSTIETTVSSCAEAEKDLLTIGALAKLCDVTVRTLRYYEEMDLIGPVKRSTGKYRLYNKQAQKRIRAITALQDLNYSLEEILVTLGAYSESLNCNKEKQVEMTRRSLESQKEIIEDKQKQLKQMKKDVQGRLDVLDNVCSPCTDGAPTTSCTESCQFMDVHY